MFDFLITIVGVLDSLPNAGRAMLSGAVLAGAFCLLERRINPDYAGLAISYRKAALVALVVIPTLVLVALDLRFVVVVEELPVLATAPQLLWWGLFGVWLTGTLIVLTRSGVALAATHRRATTFQPAAQEIAARVDFWRQKIGVSQPVAVRIGDTEQPWTSGVQQPLIVLPRSAARWPTAVQDAILVHELCHVRHRHWLWLLGGQWIGAVYWPIPWVAAQGNGLCCAFQKTSDARAIEFFGDRMGYVRALKHIAQRIDPLAHERDPAPSPLLAWGDSQSLGDREAFVLSSVTRDPCYDRVFWALAQATLAVFLLTGTTLEKIYIPDEDSFVADEFWYISFGRSSRYEDVMNWSSNPSTGPPSDPPRVRLGNRNAPVKEP